VSRTPQSPAPRRKAATPGGPHRTAAIPPEGELMYVRCAWCGRWTDVKPGPVNGVTHGMCAACARKLDPPRARASP